MAAAVVARVCRTASFCSRTVASTAGFLSTDFDGLLAAFRSFEKVDFQSSLQAVALRWSSATTTAASTATRSEAVEKVAEDIEDVIDVVEPATTSTTGCALNSIVSEAVIASTFFVVA